MVLHVVGDFLHQVIQITGPLTHRDKVGVKVIEQSRIPVQGQAEIGACFDFGLNCFEDFLYFFVVRPLGDRRIRTCDGDAGTQHGRQLAGCDGDIFRLDALGNQRFGFLAQALNAYALLAQCSPCPLHIGRFQFTLGRLA